MTVTQILDRVAQSAKEEQSFIQFGRMIDPLRCARFPPGGAVKVSRLRETPDHCRILEASDLREFHFRAREQWASYEGISAGFERGSDTSNITRLPPSLVNAPVKLVLEDRSSKLRCFVTSERIYPKRAWVGALAPGYDVRMAFVLAGVLNSALGRVLYNRISVELGCRGDDLAKSVLERLPIPAPTVKPQAFSKVALLSYRLHQLYAAQAACNLDPAELIRDHRLYLLPEVVNLYGWEEEDARFLLQGSQPTKDQPNDQAELFAQWPQTPLRPVRLVPEADLARYEELKVRARMGSIAPREVKELSRLRELIYWEDRINGDIPTRLAVTPWPGVASEQQAVRAAYGYLSRTRGQRFGVEDAVRATERLWEVTAFQSGPSLAPQERVAPSPNDARSGGKHPIGKLYIDAITGDVSESLETAQHAIAAQL